MALTPKQQRFVDEYLADRELNATAAYRRAYPKCKSDDAAGAAAARLLGNVRIKAAVAAGMNARSDRTRVTADRVVLELARIAFSDPRLLYRPDGTLKPPAEWDDDTAAAVAAVETVEEVETSADLSKQTVTTTRKVKRWDKPATLHHLMKHLGMITDKLKIDPPPARSPFAAFTDDQLRAIVAALPGAARG